MTLDKETRRSLRAEARAIYQEFNRLEGEGSEVTARRKELNRRYHEINEIIANERSTLTAEAERIPVDLAAILGNDPEDQAARAQLMVRYEEIHAILKKRPKSFEAGTADAAPDAEEEEVADWTQTPGAGDTVIASPGDLALAGLDSAVAPPDETGSGAKTVVGSPPEGFAPLPDEDLIPEVIEVHALPEAMDAEAGDGLPPESDFELPVPIEEVDIPVEIEAVGLDAFSLDQVLDATEGTGDLDGGAAENLELPDPDEVKSDSGVQEKGVAWRDFDETKNDASGDEDEDGGWVLPALSEETAGVKGNGRAKDSWDDAQGKLPPLQDLAGGDAKKSDFSDDPLLNVTRIGDGDLERKREDIPFPPGDAPKTASLWQDLPEQKG